MTGFTVDAGFRCPHCEGRMHVTDSRQSKYRGRDSIRRRRRCKKCGYALTTFETISSGNEKQVDARLGAVVLSLRRAHEAIGTLLASYDHDELEKEAAE